MNEQMDQEGISDAVMTTLKAYAGESPKIRKFGPASLQLYSLLCVFIDGAPQLAEQKIRLSACVYAHAPEVEVTWAVPADGLEFDPFPHVNSGKAFDVKVCSLKGGTALPVDARPEDHVLLAGYSMKVVDAKLKRGVNSQATLKVRFRRVDG
jgi:hypothetical protein